MTYSSDTTDTTPKAWWQSKTVWINLAAFLLGLIAYILNGVQTGEVQLDLDADTVAMILGVIGLVMRFLTTRAVRL